MIVSQSITILPVAFFILLAVSVLSALLLLNHNVPLKYVRVHIGILTLPPLTALAGLIWNKGAEISGPWRFDTLSWLLALFVLTIGLIVQRFSIRYLLGDDAYRKYFALLTVTTSADSLAWLSDDLRLLLICWGATLLGLTLLIGLKQEWHVARNASVLSGRVFAISWLVMVTAILWAAQATGQWHLSQVLSEHSLARLGSWERTCINLLLVVAVIIPAAQWPFQRWLLDSVVAPTPISAVMHAGIVNAGGIILTRFAPLFSGDAGQMILLILSCISVLIGTGIMLVQVDYKRQLVGSTMAQMGFMLIQCALGAYWAAIIHAILHGLFKATLFLEAGSVVHHTAAISDESKRSSVLWSLMGGMLGLTAGIGYWMSAPGGGYQLISAFILGWAVTIAWRQLVACNFGIIGRLAGMILFAITAIMFFFIHTAFFKLLHETVQAESQFSAIAAVLLLVMLAASLFGAWLFRNRSTTSFAIVYLWLIHLSEPQTDLVESHPKYLTRINH